MVELGLEPGGTLIEIEKVGNLRGCYLTSATLHGCPSPKDRPAMVFVMQEGDRHVRVMTYQVPLVGQLLETIQHAQ